jgi:hypothetical protein
MQLDDTRALGLGRAPLPTAHSRIIASEERRPLYRELLPHPWRDIILRCVRAERQSRLLLRCRAWDAQHRHSSRHTTTSPRGNSAQVLERTIPRAARSFPAPVHPLLSVRALGLRRRGAPKRASRTMKPSGRGPAGHKARVRRARSPPRVLLSEDVAVAHAVSESRRPAPSSSGLRPLSRATRERLPGRRICQACWFLDQQKFHRQSAF